MTTIPRETRRRWMSLLATAPTADLLALWSAFGPPPAFDWLRRPEIGSVMARGRMGAVGAAFNLGEITITRCSLRLADQRVGHGYVQGRSKAKAECAALIDALMQGAEANALRRAVLAPLAERQAAAHAARAEKVAATKVEFFTMSRGATPPERAPRHPDLRRRFRRSAARRRPRLPRRDDGDGSAGHASYACGRGTAGAAVARRRRPAPRPVRSGHRAASRRRARPARAARLGGASTPARRSSPQRRRISRSDAGRISRRSIASRSARPNIRTVQRR